MTFDPTDIEIKEFVPTLRGYDRAAVRAYLRAVADDVRRLEAQVQKLESAQAAHGGAPTPTHAVASTTVGEVGTQEGRVLAQAIVQLTSVLEKLSERTGLFDTPTHTAPQPAPVQVVQQQVVQNQVVQQQVVESPFEVELTAPGATWFVEPDLAPVAAELRIAETLQTARQHTAPQHTPPQHNAREHNAREHGPHTTQAAEATPTPQGFPTPIIERPAPELVDRRRPTHLSAQRTGATWPTHATVNTNLNTTGNTTSRPVDANGAPIERRSRAAAASPSAAAKWSTSSLRSTPENPHPTWDGVERRAANRPWTADAGAAPNPQQGLEGTVETVDTSLVSNVVPLLRAV